MYVAIAQLNQVVGDLRGNARSLAAAIDEGRRGRAALVVTPELSLSGYPPEDLLLRPAFLDACARELAALATHVHGVTALVGYPEVDHGVRHNAVAVIRDGAVAQVYRKAQLPNYTVFDEQRYFEPDGTPCVFDVDGVRCAAIICEDVWFPAPAARAKVAVAQQLPAWHETIALVRFDGATPKHVRGGLDEALEPHVYHALVMGVRDYVNKNRFPGVLIGLSGGIDSALTLAVAVDALGRERVRALMLPSRYNASISLDDAREMAAIVGVRYDEMPIEPIFNAFVETVAREFSGHPVDAAEENIQARIRGTLLMALSNKFGAIVLTTGNKSEMAVGYATLYGDMAGGFAVLRDILKTLVYRLARYRNSLGRVIPERIITRPPSAELRENQTDQDSLPPYAVLDAILEAYVERDLSPAQIVAQGFAAEHVRKVVRLIKINEYKRRQAAVGIRITPRGFGKDWRYPITSAWSEAEEVAPAR